MMDVLLVVFVGGGAIWGGVVLARLQARQQQLAAATRVAGVLQHRRSGEYPASCSWCKSTTLARKLFVFRRSDGTWRSEDVIARLRTCDDNEVQIVASVFEMDMATSRRFCSEKCTRESFQSDRIETLEAFCSCEYCSVRFPSAVIRCPNCGAARTER